MFPFFVGFVWSFSQHLWNRSTFFASNFSSSRRGSLSSLFAKEEKKKRLAHDEADICATHAGFVHDVEDIDYQTQNGSACGHVFATFKRWFLTNEARLKNCYERLFVCVCLFVCLFLSIGHAMRLRLGFPLSWRQIFEEMFVCTRCSENGEWKVSADQTAEFFCWFWSVSVCKRVYFLVEVHLGSVWLTSASNDITGVWQRKLDNGSEARSSQYSTFCVLSWLCSGRVIKGKTKSNDKRA